MNKRLSGLIAGFLIVSQLFINCAEAAMMAYTPPAPAASSGAGGGGPIPPVPPVPPVDPVDPTGGVVPSTVPDLSLLPVLPYDFNVPFNMPHEGAQYLKDRIVFINMKGEYVAFDFTENPRVGMDLVWKVGYFSADFPENDTKVYAHLEIDAPFSSYKFVNNKWVLQAYVHDAQMAGTGALDKSLRANRIFAPGESIIYSTFSLKNTNYAFYPDPVVYYDYSSFDDVLKNINIHNGTQSYVLALPLGTDTSATKDEVVLSNTDPSPLYICGDGIDNDNDSLTDESDPGCHTDWNAGNPASYDPKARSEAEDNIKCLPARYSSGVATSISGDGKIFPFTPMYINGRDHEGNIYDTRIDVFAYDTATNLSERLNLALKGTDDTWDSFNPMINNEGNYVVFQSVAKNLVAGDTYGSMDIFIRNLDTNETILISKDMDGKPAGHSSNPSIGGKNGRYVSFESDSDKLVPNDTNGVSDIFVYDIERGTMKSVSSTSGGASGGGYASHLSSASNYIAFLSNSADLVPSYTDGGKGEGDIFVRNLDTGEIERVSLSYDGEEVSVNFIGAWISPDGRYVSFYSDGKALAEYEDDPWAAGFIYDRTNKTLEKIYESAQNDSRYKASYKMLLSEDGKYAAFDTMTGDLVPGDTGGYSDVFIRNQTTHEIKRLTVSFDGTEANNNSRVSAITPDGKYILINSEASNLVKGDVNGKSNNFIIKNPFIEEERMLPITITGASSLMPEEKIPYNPLLAPDSIYLYYEVDYTADAQYLKEGDSLSHRTFPYGLTTSEKDIDVTPKVYKVTAEGRNYKAILQLKVPFSEQEPFITSDTNYTLSSGGYSASVMVKPSAENIEVAEKWTPVVQGGFFLGTKFEGSILGNKVDVVPGVTAEGNIGVSAGYESEIGYNGKNSSGDYILLGFPMTGELNGKVVLGMGAEVNLGNLVDIDAAIAEAGVSSSTTSANVEFPERANIQNDSSTIAGLSIPIVVNSLGMGMANSLYHSMEILPFDFYSPYKEVQRTSQVYKLSAEIGSFGISTSVSEDEGYSWLSGLNTSGAVLDDVSENKSEWERGLEGGNKIVTEYISSSKSINLFNIGQLCGIGDSALNNPDYYALHSIKIGLDAENGYVIELEEAPAPMIVKNGELYKFVWKNISQENIAKILGDDGQPHLENLDNVLESGTFLSTKYYEFDPSSSYWEVLNSSIGIGGGAQFELALQSEDKIQVPMANSYFVDGERFLVSDRESGISSDLNNIQNTKKTTGGVMSESIQKNKDAVEKWLTDATLGALGISSSILDDSMRSLSVLNEDRSEFLDYTGQLTGDAANLVVSEYKGAIKNLFSLRTRALRSNGGQISSTDAGINNANLDFVSDIAMIGQKVQLPLPKGGKVTLYPSSIVSTEDLADAGVYEFKGNKWEYVPAVKNADNSFTFDLKEVGIYALLRAFADDTNFLGQGFANMKPGETKTVASDAVLNADGTVAKNQAFNITLANSVVMDPAAGEIRYGESPVTFPAAVMTDESGKFSLDLIAGSLEGEAYLSLKSASGYAAQTARVIVFNGAGLDGDFKLGMEMLGYEGKMPSVGQDIKLKASTNYETSGIEWSVVDIFGNKKTYEGREVVINLDKSGVYGVYCFAKDKNGFTHQIYGELSVTDLTQDTDGDGISDDVEGYYGTDSAVADSDKFYTALEEAHNKAPVAEAGEASVGTEGAAVTFDAGESADPDGDSLTYRWDFDGDGNWDTDWSGNLTVTHTWQDDYAGTVKLQVSDGELQSEDGVSVKINNATPVINGIENKNADVSDMVNLEAGFADAGTTDTHTASIDWGDGSAVENAIVTGEALKNISTSHIYSAVGSHTATLSVQDNDGGIGTETFVVAVTKRATNLNYDGPTEARYGDTIKLSATLADKLGGLADKNVTFQIGAQTVSVVTDSSGKAKAEITIDKILGNYQVKATFPEDGIYLASEVQTQLAVKSIKQVKQEALAKLKTLASLLGEKDIEKAAADMEDALVSELWKDDFHLDAKHGQKVFDNEKQVIKNILKLMEKNKMPLSTEVRTNLQAVIDDIISSDNTLVRTDLSRAKNMTARTPEFSKKQGEQIEKAEKGLINALQEVGKGNQEKAIDEFKKVWNSVQLAIEFAAK